MTKDVTTVQDDDDVYELQEVAPKWQGTDADRHDMSVLGRAQQLRRNFQFISILGFGCTLICTWEVLLTALTGGLTNGGTGGLIWGYIIVVAGFSMIYFSIAEMASMAPTSGGQYHWVSEFSPRFCQKYLSFLTGWLCFTGWQAAIVAISFMIGTIAQALIVLHQPETYNYQNWHGTLLIIAVVLFAIIFNTLLARRLPMVEGLVLIVHVCGLFAIVIPLWILSPRKDAKAVFTEFVNAGGWNSMGTSFMVGLLASLASMLGFDCAVHMSEEVKDASRTLPRSIMWSVFLNACLGFIMIITLCFCMGDAEAILGSPVGLAGYPFIQIFFNATKSLAGTTIMVVIVLIALTGSAIAEIATASRQLWSFARDNGVPFSETVAKVTPGSNIPLNAVIISLVVAVLLSLINIGSTQGLTAILSLATVSILTSYFLCIMSVLIKRIRGEPLPVRRWSLGRLGMPINILALCFLCPVWVFAFFPTVTPTAPITMNWSIVIYGFMVIFSSIYYVVYGHKVYISPVERVQRAADELAK